MNRKFFLKTALLLCVILAPGISYSQVSDDFVNRLNANINKYYQANPHDILFVHTDRSVYFAGDEILFKAYVSDGATLLPSKRSNSCQLLLLNSSGEEVYNSFFALKGGPIHGEFRLPDNLPFGRYYLLGYPYLDDKPVTDKGFVKDIVISDPSCQIIMDYSFNKEVYEIGDKVEIVLNAYQSRNRGMSNLKFSYSVLVDGDIQEEGKGTTDKAGTAKFQISLPESEDSDVSISIKASKKKSSQEFVIPVPLREKEMKLSEKNGDIILTSPGFQDGKLLLSSAYDQTKYDDEMRVVIGLFRKGLLYWTAPGTLGQTKDLSLPASRIPSGIVNAVLFDKKGEILAETMVFNDRSDSPDVLVELDGVSYHPRSKVSAQLSLKNIKPSSETMAYLSISVTHADLQRSEELLIEDYFLVESELSGDSREDLINIKTLGEKDVNMLLQDADRNGYKWEDILSDKAGKPGKLSNISDLDLEKGIPQWFSAVNLNSFYSGIRDRRHPDASEESYKKQLENGIPVAQVIKSIKPYSLYGDKIIFPGGTNSINNQQGALIVIDNQPVGESFDILKNISPSDVESISVSTDPGQIHKYTGLNTIGVIEITTKGYGDKPRLAEAPDDRDRMINQYNGKYLAGYPDYSLEKDDKEVIFDGRSLIFWDPAIMLKGDEKAELSFYTPDVKGDYIITVQGLIGPMPVSFRTAIKVQ